MYKMHPDDIQRRNFEFQVHGVLPTLPPVRANGAWAQAHGFPCAQPEILAQARADFVNSWPPFGEPLDVEGLEAAFQLARQPRPPRHRDCMVCGTTLVRANQADGMCTTCRCLKLTPALWLD